MAKSICVVEGCNAEHIARGYCPKHYMAARRNGMETLPPREHRLTGVDTAAGLADCLLCGPGAAIFISHGGKRVECLAKHKEENVARAARRRNESSEARARRNAYHREYNRAAKYRLKLKVGVENLLDRAGWACEICGIELTVASAKIDHDHACCDDPKTTCGRCIRGVLCTRCNTGLGVFRDNADALLAASIYIQVKSSKLPAA